MSSKTNHAAGSEQIDWEGMAHLAQDALQEGNVVLAVLSARIGQEGATDPTTVSTFQEVEAEARRLCFKHGIDFEALVNPSNTASGPRVLHPAFELRRDFLLLRFQEDVPKGDKIVTRKLCLVQDESGFRVELTDDRKLEINGESFLIDDRYDSPPYLKDEWSRQDLEDFRRHEGAPEGHWLFQQLVNAVKRHVDMADPGAYVVLATWAALTFVYPPFSAVPFLLLLGAKGTGKSQTLDVLRRLCRCGQKTRSTPAAVGDMIASQRATLLLDQANRLKPELKEILTDSYRQGAARTVVDETKRGNPHRFETFGPKAFAAHKNFNRDLLDRCIQIPTAPATRDVEPISSEDRRLDLLRWQLYRFTVKNYRELFATSAFQLREALGEELDLKGRELELWWPFEAVFEWLDVPEADRETAREFYRSSITSTKAELDDTTEAILRSLQVVLDQNGDGKVRSDELAEWVEIDLDRTINPGRLGKRLHELGLVRDSRRVRTEEGRPTEWTINQEGLKKQLQAWKLEE